MAAISSRTQCVRVWLLYLLNICIMSWWRHQMETFSALLALCVEVLPVAGDFPAQRPVTRSFDVFFDLRLNICFSKKPGGRWLETISSPLWRHCSGITLWSPPLSAPLNSRAFPSAMVIKFGFCMNRERDFLLQRSKFFIQHDNVVITKWRCTTSRGVYIHIKTYEIFSKVSSLRPITSDHISTLNYNDVIMGTMASQITSLTIVYSAVYSSADQRKHQSSASLAFVWGIHRGPVNSPHKWPVTRNFFFHLMTSSWNHVETADQQPLKISRSQHSQ